VSDPLAGFLEGLVGEPGGAGFYGGYGFREGLKERKRKFANEQEDRTYERARRLREDVGFRLQQRVREGELAAQARETDEYTRRTTQEADRRARVKAAADAIRQKYGTDQRYQGLTLLPDEDLVREFGDILTHPERFETRRRQRETEQRQDLASVERQVDDTRADVARYEREAPRRPMFFLSPSDSTRFVADSAASASRVGALRQRADSLSTVRDSIAAQVQGRSFTRPSSKTPAQWVSEVRKEHPDWTPEQVAAEARRRAGVR
jgi:hypothetical protein